MGSSLCLPGSVPAVAEDVREIPLSSGFVALVDAADFDWLNQWKWHAKCSKTGRYAQRAAQQGGPGVPMHRLLVELAPGYFVDHINGNGLDNRRANLRPCTHAENMRNRRGLHGKWGLKGIHQIRGRFYAQITVDGHRHYSSGCDTPEQAARAYDVLARRYHGEFARLNFPARG